MERLKFYIIAAICILIFAALYCIRLWQPERQAVLHTKNLLKAAGKRDWPKVSTFLDSAYTDRWRHDKASAVAEAREPLQQFFILSITPESPAASGDGRRSIVTARLRLSGNGSAIAQEVIRQVNDLRAPFTFEWQRKSWKPWDWQLTRVDNAELQFSRETGI